ncbi:MAG: NHL repeat-containing protein [Balneolales bacterium]
MRLVLCLILLFYSTSALFAQGQASIEYTTVASGLNDARSIYATSAGNLFIAETGNHRILKISSDGMRLDSLGRLGSGDYQFDRPLDVDATNGLKIYVSDYNNYRIQVYDRHFQYIATVELPRRLHRERTYSPTQIRINHIGQLFFYDEESRQIFKYDAYGRYEQQFDTRGEYQISSPTDIATAGDELFISDARHNAIHRLNTNGSYLGFFEIPSLPLSLTIYHKTIYVITDGSIITYNLRGQLLQEYPIIGISDVRGLAVFRDLVYILSDDHVYRTKLNQ